MITRDELLRKIVLTWWKIISIEMYKICTLSRRQITFDTLTNIKMKSEWLANEMKKKTNWIVIWRTQQHILANSSAGKIAEQCSHTNDILILNLWYFLLHSTLPLQTTKENFVYTAHRYTYFVENIFVIKTNWMTTTTIK